MDGNGRWAVRRGLPRVAGHRAGVAAVRRVIEHAAGTEIRRLTIYAFSSDNWTRPPQEVESIFWLLRAYLRLETKRMHQRGVQMRVIGRRDRLAGSVLREIEKAERATRCGQRLELRVAIDYSSRHAISLAAAEAVAEAEQTGQTCSDRLQGSMAKAMVRDGRDVDLLIRTGGEKRLSDFLLWECAYAELLFTDTMWPDFAEADLDAALEEFHRRERRFGGVPVAQQNGLDVLAKS